MKLASSVLAAACAAALSLTAAAAAPDALKDPSKVTAKSPEVFKAKFDTTKGVFVIEVHRDWAPNGADRFYALVKNGYYDGVKFFRVVPGFVVQWGIHGDPAIAKTWLQSTIKDDPVKESNKKGYVTYAKSNAPNSRSVQLFINLQDNTGLDSKWFAPFGKVVEGMDVVNKLNGEYTEGLTQLQGRIADEGNAFLEKHYPNLDAINKATIE
jgi:peptidyl-prolyl cis-trans isomerase A (cyclophilin A)